MNHLLQKDTAGNKPFPLVAVDRKTRLSFGSHSDVLLEETIMEIMFDQRRGLSRLGRSLFFIVSRLSRHEHTRRYLVSQLFLDDTRR